ncbi:MAG: hypothetical protein IKQ07_06720 [Bacteroidaceae bacterium]|nr:hypothetical protein [Bacteroidaceae bacterium]MBR6375418.1 hypothetical protein [Alloprevotella sp.]
MKKTTFRLLSLFLVMFAMSQPSQAGQLWDALQDFISQIQKSNNYHSAIVATPVGEGKVYVRYINNDASAYTPKSYDWEADSIVVSTPNNGESTSGNQKWRLYAQANSGYKFVGWYKTDATCSGNPESAATPYEVSVLSVHGNEINNQNSPGIHHYYAKFAPNTVSVKVTSAGYATFCSEYAVDFTNSGIEAFTATLNGTSLTLNAITQVPANTGVILVAEGGKTAEVPTVVGSVTPVTNNCLTGVNKDTTLDPDDLILNVKNGKPGFYRAASNTTLRAHRAYISKTYFAGEVKDFTFDEEDATGIETIENAVEDGAIYNMAGQRLNKMQKGINIVNGKKILKK